MRNRIILFTADYCGTCKQVHPIMEGIPHETADLSPVPPEGDEPGVIKGQDAIDLANQLGGITALPTIVVVTPDGKEAYRHMGLFGRSELEDVLRAADAE